MKHFKTGMKFFYILLLLSAPFGLMAQKETASENQIWAGYFNQTRLSDKWGVWADAHLRTKENFTQDLSQAIARFGLTYYLTDNTKLTAGYAYVNHFPADAHPDVSQPEHRPWQQIQWHNRFPNLRLMQWVRFEERYRRKIKDPDELAEGYNFNYKARYNFFLATPITKKAFEKGALSFVVNDEVHINFGKQVVYNYFDQNRFFAGFSYHTNAHDNLQFGYMNLFQQLPVGNKYRALHTIRVFYFQNLDFRKRGKA